MYILDVKLLAPSSIGDNVIIGANSVVTSDIPSNSIAAGIPARVIRYVKYEDRMMVSNGLKDVL